MIYLKDAHKQFKAVLFINVKGRVSDSFISDSDKEIEKWMEKRSGVNGLFAINYLGNLKELVPYKEKNVK